MGRWQVGRVCKMELHLSDLEAIQLHRCACKQNRRNSNILQCCSLGVYEDTRADGRHWVLKFLQDKLWVHFCACANAFMRVKIGAP